MGCCFASLSTCSLKVWPTCITQKPAGWEQDGSLKRCGVNFPQQCSFKKKKNFIAQTSQLEILQNPSISTMLPRGKSLQGTLILGSSDLCDSYMVWLTCPSKNSCGGQHFWEMADWYYQVLILSCSFSFPPSPNLPSPKNVMAASTPQI